MPTNPSTTNSFEARSGPIARPSGEPAISEIARPSDERCGQSEPQRALMSHDRRRGGLVEVDRRRGCEAGRDDQADRRCDHESDAAMLEQHARRRESMQSEEACTRQAGEAGEQHARVAAAPGRLAHQQPEPSGEHCVDQDEPEVRGVAIPPSVKASREAQNDERYERKPAPGEPGAGFAPDGRRIGARLRRTR